MQNHKHLGIYESVYSEKKRSLSLPSTKKMWAIVCTLCAVDGYLVGTAVTKYHDIKQNEAQLNGPIAACDILYSEKKESEREKAANDCIDSRRGKVALVGYGVPIDDIRAAADEAESIVIKGTNGLSRPEIIPMIAYPAAEQEYAEISLGCDFGNAKKSGAYAADTVMNLSQFDTVVAVMSNNDCLNSGAGVTFNENESRYVDIYDANSKPKYSSDFSGQRDGLANYIAHELGHTYGLGHIDSLYLPGTGYDLFRMRYVVQSKNIDSNVISDFDETISYWNPSTVVDLTPPITKITNEYYRNYGGDSNLMARHTPDISLMAVQQWQLEWPERISGEVRDRQVVINQTETTLITPASTDRDFVTFRLNEKAAFQHEGPMGEEVIDEYDKLIFDPVPNSSYKFSVYFAKDRDAHILSLGEIKLSDTTEQTLRIKINDQVIQLQSIAGGQTKFVDISDKFEMNNVNATSTQQPK